MAGVGKKKNVCEVLRGKLERKRQFKGPNFGGRITSGGSL
jgi:hypothetical protein